eukprot:GEZU01005162.1.p1 GENE.GEZU01005162.1~~GEZU01005162.1.p1  ORF type:complete len:195 (+),score=38.33 GEZU01005162.1:289-873(+)
MKPVASSYSCLLDVTTTLLVLLLLLLIIMQQHCTAYTEALRRDQHGLTHNNEQQQQQEAEQRKPRYLFTTVFNIEGDKVSVQAISGSDGIPFKSWGGDMEIVDPRKQVRTKMWDSDGDVFFKLVCDEDPSSFCVVDSTEKRLGHSADVKVFQQHGLAGSARFDSEDKETHTFYYTLTIERTHDKDCIWNGTKCE